MKLFVVHHKSSVSSFATFWLFHYVSFYRVSWFCNLKNCLTVWLDMLIFWDLCSHSPCHLLALTYKQCSPSVIIKTQTHFMQMFADRHDVSYEFPWKIFYSKYFSLKTSQLVKCKIIRRIFHVTRKVWITKCVLYKYFHDIPSYDITKFINCRNM